MAQGKVVLAYSGGLDTSVCIKWLMEEKDLDVIALIGDVGQERQDLDFVKQKALDSGAVEALVVDMREEFVAEYLSKALFANALYENKYPLVSALSRPVIVKYLVQAAEERGAEYIAHGCTGKGNDQARFEVGIRALNPDIKIIAPLREWDLVTRDQEIAWAEKHGIPVPVTTASPYSIDDNLWGRAIECGIIEDPWEEPPFDIYAMTTNPTEAADEPLYITIGFEAGLPVSIDGKKVSYMDAILQLNERAGAAGFGRIDMIENRLIGVKSHEIYEAPGALALITAHKALEELVLERDTLRYKHQIEQDWASYVYDAKWFSPLREALDGFIASTQGVVCGEVRLKLYKGSCAVVGRKSDLALYDVTLATYGEEDSFDREAAAGFIELFGLPTQVWGRQQRKL
ncbi:MAG: argininosuccinate synthase [Coriobacteriia bacterium]|jgi:argininosuccinate synthase|nr:argininosuccinate synthase [Coriobacteriia bacterium]MDR2715074.1 argininosuccinate synthase [Coriobacteriales bacterium]